MTAPPGVLVLGATGGIGAATVERLIGDGARVIAVGRDPGRLRAASAAGAIPVAADLADEGTPDTLARAVRDHLGGVLDGLVAASGGHGPVGPTRTVDGAALRASLEENLLGVIAVVQALAPALDRAEAPSVVLLSGGGGTGPRPGYTAYALAKVATVRLAENLALEEPSWRVNAVAPGYVATAIHDGSDEPPPASAVPASVPAGLIAWLLGPGAIGVTGRLISAPWDPWGTPDGAALLRDHPTFGRLRRVDGARVIDADDLAAGEDG